MIKQSVSLASNGVVKVPGYEQLVRFGYTKNRGVYRLSVTASGEWEGLTIRAFWHVPDGKDPASSLVVDGYVDVPASVTSQPGSGCITFEGSDGERTVTSADLHYHVSENSGTEDGTQPEPGTPAWQQLVDAVHADATAAEQAKIDAQTAAQQAGASAKKAGQALSDTIIAKEDALKAIGDKQTAATQAVDTARDKALKQVEASTKAAQTSASEAATSAGSASQSAQEAADSLQKLKEGIAAGDFKGEPGPAGPAGPVGPQGEQGPKGETGPAVALDTTLSISGKAADAAKVGEAVGELKQDKLDKPTAPVVGQVLRVKSISDTGEITLETVSGGLPEGGTTGQVLVKKTDAEGDCAWVDPQTATVRTSMDDVALAGAKYILGEQAALSITMPTDAQTGQEIMVVFSSGQTACTLAVDLDDFDFVPKANSMCKIVFLCVAADTWLVDAKEG